MSKYKRQVAHLIAHAEEYHQSYYNGDTCDDPSLYFHRKSLDYKLGLKSRLEYIYATLPAWGMHRMGKRGAKMGGFEKFCKSTLPFEDQINRISKLCAHQMTEDDWEIVESIFKGIKVMATKVILIGNSKVMAHLIPNVVPPIDRENTLAYLHGKTTIQNNVAKQWMLMKDIISEFFVPVALNEKFRSLTVAWVNDQKKFPWDTSVFKVIDNLIRWAPKAEKKPSKRR